MDSSRADVPARSDSQDVAAGDVIESESLVEEVSIDGMCGVY
ncbi:mycofactocin precursor MftA [uncultured Amnibacterium sp.]